MPFPEPEMFEQLDYYSQLRWIQWRQENSPTPKPGNEDYEESPYIREPIPSLPTFVDELGEDELRTLYRRHTQANFKDDVKAIEYQQQAETLRAQANEYDALARKYADRVTFGNEVTQLLQSSMKVRSQSTSTGCKGVSRTIFVPGTAKADSQAKPEDPSAVVVRCGYARVICTEGTANSQDAGAASTTLLPPLPGLPLNKATRSKARRDTSPRKKFATKVEDHPWPDKDHKHPLSKVRVGTRMVSHTRPWEHILIYTDGSCLNQNSKIDTQHRRAGCGVVFGMTPSGVSPFQPTSFSFRLEDHGRDGNYYVATSNRAELRAATAAL